MSNITGLENKVSPPVSLCALSFPLKWSTIILLHGDVFVIVQLIPRYGFE